MLSIQMADLDILAAKNIMRINIEKQIGRVAVTTKTIDTDTGMVVLLYSKIIDPKNRVLF